MEHVENECISEPICTAHDCRACGILSVVDNGVAYPVKVNKNGEHYYVIGSVVYRLPWLDNKFRS